MNLSKTAIFVLTTALSGLFLFAGSALQTDTPGVRLRAAIEKEEVEGDLQAAIEQYKKLIANNRDNRAVAASALLRLGGCYEKLGQEDARRAYERVVNDYAEQAEPVQEARRRLAALNKTGAKETGTVARKVWADRQTDFNGNISPDGRYLSYVDWDTGDLAVRNLEKGTNRRITDKGSWESSDETAELSVWSPDGKSIAYEWSGLHGYELRLVGLDNPTPRILYRCDSKQNEWIDPHDWSPDGKYVLATLNRRNEGQKMMLISVADGTVHTLKQLSRPTSLSGVAISPDGRYVVYDYPQSEFSLLNDIFLIPIAGGNEKPLVAYPSDDLVLGWTPDGQWLLFTSDRRGSVDVWAVRIENGEPLDEPIVVKPAVGRIHPLGITRASSLYYGIGSGKSDVYVAAMRHETGGVTAAPDKAIKHSEGFNSSPRYSPDGKYLAYITTRPRTPSSPGWGNTLCIRSLETGEEREYQREMIQLGARTFSRPCWSPDGRSLLLHGRDDKNLYGIYHIDLETAKAVRILDQGEYQMIGPAEGWPDPWSFIYGRLDKKNDRGEAIIRNLRDGSEKVLTSDFPLKIRTEAAVSSDSQWMSTLSQSGPEDYLELEIISIASGEVLHHFKFSQEDSPASFRHTWSADSRYIFYTRRVETQGGYKSEVWRIAADGGQPQKTGLEMPGVIYLMSAHPDGEHIAFENRMTESPAEVWVMENFLPQSEQDERRIP